MSFFSREMASFVEIARARSLRQAAQQLNVSASALSRQISILEHAVGAQLMTRLPGGMRLTPKGLALLRRAEEWIEDAARLELELRSTREAGTLTFKLGIMECLGSTLLPGLSMRLQACGALANCSVTVGDTSSLFAQLSSGAQDAILAFNLPRQKDILEKYVHIATERCPSLANKRVSPHVLRHSCALAVLEATKDLRKVSLWLGHAHMQTTEMYTRADPSIKLEALNAMTAPHLRSGRFRASDKLIASLKARSVMRREERSK